MAATCRHIGRRGKEALALKNLFSEALISGSAMCCQVLWQWLRSLLCVVLSCFQWTSGIQKKMGSFSCLCYDSCSSGKVDSVNLDGISRHLELGNVVVAEGDSAVSNDAKKFNALAP